MLPAKKRAARSIAPASCKARFECHQESCHKPRSHRSPSTANLLQISLWITLSCLITRDIVSKPTTGGTVGHDSFGRPGVAASCGLRGVRPAIHGRPPTESCPTTPPAVVYGLRVFGDEALRRCPRSLGETRTALSVSDEHWKAKHASSLLHFGRCRTLGGDGGWVRTGGRPWMAGRSTLSPHGAATPGRPGRTRPPAPSSVRAVSRGCRSTKDVSSPKMKRPPEGGPFNATRWKLRLPARR